MLLAVVVVAVLLRSPAVGVIGIVASLLVSLILLKPEPRPSIELRRLNAPDLYPVRRNHAQLMRFVRGEKAEDEVETPGAELETVGRNHHVGERRPLDVDAIASSQVELLRKQTQLNSRALNLMLKRQPPTKQQLAEFDEKVADYVARLRSWLVEVDDHLDRMGRSFELEVQLLNDSGIDAEGARVELIFPSGFASAEQLAPPDQPEAPEIPVGPPSALTALDGLGAYGRESYLDRFGPSLLEPRSAEFDFDPSAPDYEELADGGLAVSYGAQTIRHRRRSSAGPPLRLVCSDDGDHQVEWRIHAGNLTRPRSGRVILSAKLERRGDPIQSLWDLQSVLGTLETVEDDLELAG